MRIALIAALKRTQTGDLRAELPFVGRSVLSFQVDFVRNLGAERVLCLCHAIEGEVLRLQHEVEKSGAEFHALTGFSALSSLVRAEDDLIILCDGLLPDPALARAGMRTDRAPQRMVLCLPSDQAMTIDKPQDFERIDATRHWAGLLVMRGAAVQKLADFPVDADAISVLLRLALQAGTPLRELGTTEFMTRVWVLADSLATLATHEHALITRAAKASDWRAPLLTLGGLLVSRLAPRGLGQGAVVAASLAVVFAAGGVAAAALGNATTGLAMAAAGVFSGNVASAYAQLIGQLQRQSGTALGGTALGIVLDVLAAFTLWFALAPLPQWTPLAVCGPLVLGLARLGAREQEVLFSAFWRDRASLLVLLTFAAAMGFLPEVTAALAVTVLMALLLRKAKD